MITLTFHDADGTSATLTVPAPRRWYRRWAMRFASWLLLKVMEDDTPMKKHRPWSEIRVTHPDLERLRSLEKHTIGEERTFCPICEKPLLPSRLMAHLSRHDGEVREDDTRG